MQNDGVIESRHYLTCLWPGLSELWWRGRLSSLPVAIVFAIAVNLLLVMRFLYPQWLSGVLVQMACWIGIATWVFFVIRGVRELPALLTPRTISEEPDLFPNAQLAYLTAEWDVAEKSLMEVLSIEPRDPPALLLLSGVYRHTERAEAAQVLMSEMQRLEVADPWLLEIEAEMSRINAHLGIENAEENNASHDDETPDKKTEQPAEEPLPN